MIDSLVTLGNHGVRTHQIKKSRVNYDKSTVQGFMGDKTRIDRFFVDEIERSPVWAAIAVLYTIHLGSLESGTPSPS